jgi:hypothetical protein
LEQSFEQTLKEIASEAQAAFPQELKNLVILLTSSPDDPLAYAAPAVEDHLKKNPAAIKAAAEERAKHLRDRGSAGVANSSYNLAGITVNLIAFDTDLARSFGRFTEEMCLIKTLDHELYHLIDTSYKLFQHERESAADAYAMLRHIQRFGKIADYEGDMAKRRARQIILRSDPDHYTSDSLERAIQISEERDISGLSLQKTVALAEEIAHECHLDNKKLEKLQKAFRSAQKSYRNGECVDIVNRKVVSVMKRHRRNADIFRAGQRYFNVPERRSLMDKWARKSSYWQEAQKFIQDPEAKPPRYGILRRAGFKS